MYSVNADITLGWFGLRIFSADLLPVPRIWLPTLHKRCQRSACSLQKRNERRGAQHKQPFDSDFGALEREATGNKTLYIGSEVKQQLQSFSKCLTSSNQILISPLRPIYSSLNVCHSTLKRLCNGLLLVLNSTQQMKLCRPALGNHLNGHCVRNLHSSLGVQKRTVTSLSMKKVKRMCQNNFSYSSILSTRNGKSFEDSILNVLKESSVTSKTTGAQSAPQLSLKEKRLLGFKSKKSKSKTSQRIKEILPHFYSEDGEPLPTLTVEKQLLGLMQMWAMEEAVELLKESVQNGADPDRTVILNLLQQLANLGEVECLLELHEFLKDRGLSNNLKFYHCLRDAYFNSGRVEDGILMLRVIYHGSRDFGDTDLLFTLLATMTAKHFEHMLPVVESYVTDLAESDPPVTSARASLWHCFVLAEKFEKADALLEEFPEVKKIIPAQITKLIQSQLEVDFDHDIVLTWLMNSPYVKPRLAASLFNMLILHKSSQGHWSEGLKALSNAMSDGRKIHRKTVEDFLAKFFNQLSEDQVKELSAWANDLQNLPENEE